jgi:biopolymer transport protein ExbD
MGALGVALDFKRRNGRGSAIPTASIGDIAFLLLIFFMVTTIFVKETGLVVDLPRAEAGEMITQDPVSNVYINKRGQISIDDMLVSPQDVSALMGQKISANPDLIVAFKADQETPYRVVSDVMEQLKEVSALRVSFGTMPDGNPGRKY